MTSIQQNIQTLYYRIRQFEIQYHRQPNSVSLLAVTKARSIDDIREALAAGQLAFDENYLQEALKKITALHNEKIEWHFIGPIQSNKTKKIAEYFSWVHTVSHKNIAERLSKQRPAHLSPLNICLQVNTSHEKTKSGINPNEVLELASFCATLSQIKLRGLMTIPATQKNFAEQREEFAQLRLIYEMLNKNNFKLDVLSMGMSEDLEAAIAENATILRVGTAIFGNRIGHIIP